MNFGNISAKDIIFSLKKYIWKMLGATLVGGLLLLFISAVIISPKYESYLDIYVTSTSRSGENSDINYDEITASQKLVNTYMVILQTQDTFDRVNELSNLDYTFEELEEILTFTNVNSTEILRVTATTENPVDAYMLCKAFSEVASDILTDVIEGGSVKIVSTPRVSEEPVSPNILLNTVIGCAIGLLIALVYCIINMSTTSVLSTIRDEEQITDIADKSVLGNVPSLSTGGFSLGGLLKGRPHRLEAIYLNEESSEDVREAYENLRVNVSFAAKAKKKKIIVVTSYGENEFRALTAVNLAESFAETGRTALLIDADMRSGSLHRMFGVENKFGLSSFLADLKEFDDCIQDCHNNLDIITCGPTPSEPAEMLESNKMKILLKNVSNFYDIIIVNSAPIGMYADASALASESAGYIMTVRNEHTTENQLKTAMNNLDGFECGVLGVVMTGSVSKSQQI